MPQLSPALAITCDHSPASLRPWERPMNPFIWTQPNYEAIVSSPTEQRPDGDGPDCGLPWGLDQHQDAFGFRTVTPGRYRGTAYSRAFICWQATAAARDSLILDLTDFRFHSALACGPRRIRLAGGKPGHSKDKGRPTDETDHGSGSPWLYCSGGVQPVFASHCFAATQRKLTVT